MAKMEDMVITLKIDTSVLDEQMTDMILDVWWLEYLKMKVNSEASV